MGMRGFDVGLRSDSGLNGGGVRCMESSYVLYSDELLSEYCWSLTLRRSRSET